MNIFVSGMSKILLFLLLIYLYRTNGLESHPSWIINAPFEFHHSLNVSQMAEQVPVNESVSGYTAFLDEQLSHVDGFTDGEIVDVVEHFFWGKRGGLAIELGALDGSSATRSMTFMLENRLGWRRILIEGNPGYVKALKMRSPYALSVSAAICSIESKVHFSDAPYVGGIVEFMSPVFLKQYHPIIFAAASTGDGKPMLLQNVSWNSPSIATSVKEIDCIPLSTVLRKAHAKHVNFFILDVEGGEMEVLKSIDWNYTRFDVLCIETDPGNRPPLFRENITAILAPHGYANFSGQKGRNTWYIHKSFTPALRPGLDARCFNGVLKSEWSERWFVNRKTAPFQRCSASYS
jgi:hypothetical protein